MPEDTISSFQAPRRILGAVLLLSLPLLLPALVLVSCEYIENPTSRYSTYQSAREAGALEEGRWIPPFLPESARNLVETHNIDSNVLKISFEYSPDDLGGLISECRELKVPSGGTRRFECRNWGLPIDVYLESSGNGLVLSRNDT